MLETIELWHPSMASSVRLVVDEVNLIATLEIDAPRNPGETVTFKACYMVIEKPEESDKAATPEVTIRIDNVSGDIADVLDTARESSDPSIRDATWQLIERVYASDDATGPAVLPTFKLTPIRVAMQGASALVTAAYRPSVNTSIPAITFTPEKYPGLLQ
jgi:hypothetical protein